MTAVLKRLLLDYRYELKKQTSIKSWLVENEDQTKFVVQQFYSKNKNALDSYHLNKKLFEVNHNSSIYFVLYEQQIIRDDYYFIIKEHCNDGDLNTYLIENRYKSKDGVQIARDWIKDLLEGIRYLEKNGILHPRLTTYTVYVSNRRLKIDGLKYAKLMDSKAPIAITDKYGMYNSPELVKHGKVNFKYHTWCLGWLIYEIATCEWQHYKLANEDFLNWNVPNLPYNYPRYLNHFFKKSVKLSPGSRPSSDRLYQLMQEFNKRSQEKNESSGLGSSNDSYLQSLNQRFDRTFKNEDDYYSDSDDDEYVITESDHQLEVIETFEKRNVLVEGRGTRYKIKELIESTTSYDDYLAKQANTERKYRKAMRFIKYKDQKELALDKDYLSQLIQQIRELKNPFITIYDECFQSSLGQVNALCHVGEFFEDGNMEKNLQKMNLHKKHFSEDRIFDCIYYIVDALYYLHSRGIAHRDLRPKNIFLRNERIKIGNFGVRGVLESQYSAANIEKNKESSCYISPECFFGRDFKSRFNDRNDIWSLGCLMFEMCTLRAPVQFKDMLYYKEHMSQKEFPVPEIETSVRLKGIFSAMMKREAERTDAKQIYQKLNHIIKEEKSMYENFERDFNHN